MAQPEIRGPAGVRAQIAAFLREWVPAHAEAARTAWDLTEDQMPVPVSAPDDPRTDAYLPRELGSIDRWPVLSVTTGRLRQTEVDHDLDSADIIVDGIYPVRIFTWVKTAGWNATVDQRDNLATVVRIACMSHQQLGSANLMLIPSTLIVEASRVEPVKGDRFVAGSFVGFDVRVTETLTDRLTIPGAPARDRVASVTADATILLETP